ncbi:MAG: GIY-YIG nuclease family protein [Planctomycetes bacterium]|nr:GIY-YIG nuclease family protein [Planctomycetota bacterium]
MLYVVAFLVGLLLGAGALIALLIEKQSRLRSEKNRLAEEDERLKRFRTEIERGRKTLTHEAEQVKVERREFDARVISYKELHAENLILKRDLQNIDVDLRKLQLDRELQRESQAKLDERTKELGGRYLKENVKWIGSSLTANNFAACKKRLLTVIERCRGIGFDVTPDEEATLLADLKTEFEKAVRAALEREEQARIKAQIREEQQLEKEIERELKQLEREQAAIQAALEKALAEAKDEHSEEVERLKARLADAEQRAERTKSRAEMTKSGHVYVISNIGSFGEAVLKIGMTRRLEPNDRVRELGDASVPFPFDVHMMVSSDDAPKLENSLHKALHGVRVNKVNPRKEFFKTDIETVRQLIEENHGEVDYVVDAEALEYRQSLEISDDDEEYIERVYGTLSDDDEISADDD